MTETIEIRPGRLLHITVHENPNSIATIFLLHGMGGGSRQWREQIKALRNNYTLVIPDLLGHGDSDKPKPDHHTNPYSFNELNADIQAMFDKFANKKNVVIGHSYGGALALSLTAHNQTKIDKLILIAPTACQPKRDVPVLFYLPASWLECIRPFLESMFKKMAFDASTDPQLIEDEYRASKVNHLYVTKAIALDMKKMPTLDVSQVNTPTLIISGESDKIIPLSEIKSFYSKLPRHRFELLKKAGHLVMLEQPQAVNQLITEFL